MFLFHKKNGQTVVLLKVHFFSLEMRYNFFKCFSNLFECVLSVMYIEQFMANTHSSL